jgi:hypothetical protein
MLLNFIFASHSNITTTDIYIKHKLPKRPEIAKASAGLAEPFRSLRIRPSGGLGYLGRLRTIWRAPTCVLQACVAANWR